MKTAVVVGSGAGGATVAKELQGAFQVTVVEAGGKFRRFSRDPASLARWKRLGLFFDEREIQVVFRAMKIRKTRDMILVCGHGIGGTTTIATASALRLDRDLKKLGIHLDEEFESLTEEIPISSEHQRDWRPATRRLFDVCEELGLSPWPVPKMGQYGRCRHCGRCVLGCPFGIKWDSRQFLASALHNGARLLTGTRVRRVLFQGGQARGVEVQSGRTRRTLAADLIILSAGGLGTPLILQNSGISVEPRLFVDPVLCVAGELRDSHLDEEVSMPFVFERDGYIVAPYFDFLSFFFNKKWAYPAGNILSLMIKLSDSPEGNISARGVQKTLSPLDKSRLEDGVSFCREILARLGLPKEKTFLGTVNAGHPGGMLPLTAETRASFHHPSLPENLYVADASLLPSSLGKPPILTIAAMAKRVGRVCRDKWG